MSLNYLLDEHVPHRLQFALLRQNPSLVVWRIGEPGSPALGTLDPEILIWCEVNDFLLVTNNRKSFQRHLDAHLASGHHVPGILTLNVEMSLQATVDELALIADASLKDEYRDLILFLPLS